MILPATASIILHRMAALEARDLSATGALVAKFRGDAVNRQTIERLDAASERLDAADTPRAETARLDRAV